MAPPSNFKQNIPDGRYLNRKRASVFQKVDLKDLDMEKIPQYPKTT